MQNTAQNTPVIDPPCPGLIFGQMRLNGTPRIIVQPE